MVQSIEDRRRDKSPLAWPGSLGFDPPWNSLPNPLVRRGAVETTDVFLDDVMQMSFSNNQQVIEAFSPHTSQEPFAERVGFPNAVGCLQDFN